MQSVARVALHDQDGERVVGRERAQDALERRRPAGRRADPHAGGRAREGRRRRGRQRALRGPRRAQAQLDASDGEHRLAGLVCTYDDVCTTECDLSIVTSTLAIYNTPKKDYRSEIAIGQNTSACTAALTNVPVWATGTGDVCGGTLVKDTTKPIYSACRRETAGWETDQSVCGPLFEWANVYSAPGLTYAQVRATADYPATDGNKAVMVARAAKSSEARPRCLTTEEMPMSSSQEVVAKFDQAMSAYGPGKADGAHTKDPALDAKIRKALKLLYELRGDLLLEHMQAVLTEAQGTHDELATSGRKGGLLRQVTELDLRTLDARELRTQSLTLIDAVDRLLYPYIKLKYTTTDVTPLSALRTRPLSTSIAVLADDLRQAVSQVDTDLGIKANGGPPPGEPTIAALAFPRPGSTSYRRLWREADAERSAKVWEQIRSGETIRFPVRIDDLCQSGAGSSSLDCHEHVPVISAMGVYVAVPATTPFDDYNSQERWVNPFLSPVMTWPGDTGPETFVFGDPDWLTPKLTVLYGAIGLATHSFLNLPSGRTPAVSRGASAGVSPFSEFLFAPAAASFLDPITSFVERPDGSTIPAYETEAIVLLFALDTKVGPNLGWIPACSQ